MPTVPNSEAEILNISKLPWDTRGNGWFATDSQVCKWMSGSDPRTGTFRQRLLTTDDTICSVTGVYIKCEANTCHIPGADFTKGLKSRFTLKFKTLVLNFVNRMLSLWS